MEPIFSPCSRANISSSGRRAMLPSGFRISTSTPAGSSPASMARSTPASVWPARVSTPPGWAISGKMWPGWCRSDGLALGFTAVRMVCARSCAEMPVVTPSAASMLTVKLVWNWAVLACTIGARPRSAARVRVSGRHTRPRPWVTMKLMSLAFTSSAAMIRSPSFSRSSSSTMTTMRPRRMSSRISGMGAKFMRGLLHPTTARHTERPDRFPGSPRCPRR